MSELTRRQLLRAGLGAGQLALLGGIGALAGSGSRARASVDPAKRFVSIYMSGGWMPQHFAPAISAAEYDRHVLPQFGSGGDASFLARACTGADITNLDGSGDAPADDPRFQRVRYGARWNPAAPGDPSGDPLGYAWSHHRLWEDACIVHGVDRESLAHTAARVGAMCGFATENYQLPAIHAVIANALSLAGGASARPIASASLASLVLPTALELASTASPISFVGPSPATLSRHFTERSQVAWEGLRDRAPHGARFDGTAGPEIMTTAMDRWALERLASFRGRSNAATDAFLEQTYDGYRLVSARLANDIVTALEATPGWADEGADTYPAWRPAGGHPYAVEIPTLIGVDASGPDLNQREWVGPLDLALKLIRSDLATSISLYLPGSRGFAHDSHSPSGPTSHYFHGRALHEIVGRFLGKLKSEGLLETTCVMIFSEFSRTWSGDDHWGWDSVILAGGGVAGNRMIGGYDFSGWGSAPYGPIGKPVDVLHADGTTGAKLLNGRDLMRTIGRAFGIDASMYFLPNEPGEIAGVLS